MLLSPFWFNLIYLFMIWLPLNFISIKFIILQLLEFYFLLRTEGAPLVIEIESRLLVPIPLYRKSKIFCTIEHNRNSDAIPSTMALADVERHAALRAPALVAPGKRHRFAEHHAGHLGCSDAPYGDSVLCMAPSAHLQRWGRQPTPSTVSARIRSFLDRWSR